MSEQDPIIAFLSRPETYGSPEPVERIETHAPIVFLAGAQAYKLKRAVKLPYLDFSTTERRIAACQREFTLNAVAAPMIYRRVVPIVKRGDGALVFDGAGETVDAVIEMARFDQSALLDQAAREGRFSLAIAEALANEIARYHNRAPRAIAGSGYERLTRVADLNRSALQTTNIYTAAEINALDGVTRRRLEPFASTLDARAAAGHVRRGHGDLHLRNICLIDGRPVLYDCLDFSEELATVDVLYDLAFLLMDLWHAGLHRAANLIANRYCDLTGDDGYAVLPVLMAMRATIRAHVQATLAAQRNDIALASQSRAYFNLTLNLLQMPAPMLVAIGGYSGSGKTTIAEGLAPAIAPAPGARILETDRIRKAMHGVSAQTRLPPEAYTPAISEAVYRALTQQAHALVQQGASVVAAAVFDREETRRMVEQAAGAMRFAGLWLKVREAVLQRRLSSREAGASDATTEILKRQLSLPVGRMDWAILDSGEQDADGTLATVERLLALRNPSRSG